MTHTVEHLQVPSPLRFILQLVSVVTGSRPHKVEAFTHDKHTQVFLLYMVACSSRQPKPPKGRQPAFHRSPPAQRQKASLLTCPETEPAKGYDQLGN